MHFLIEHYEEEIIEQLFDWDNENNRVSFEEFIEWINEKCKMENTPEQFEKDLEVLDDDQNGTAAIEDVIRVMKSHEKMDDEDINLFIKICHRLKMIHCIVHFKKCPCAGFFLPIINSGSSNY